ncbi:MAG TPA: flippase-like domain-containing protein [Micavibrio sp.]|nr:flippase-like domain-containing protein [Micavibrio sp.]HIL29236.1 flippase-like domain-containing protein [Micavibrio sp.]
MNKTPTKTKHKAFWIAASIAVFLGAVTFMITQDMVLMSQVWQSVTLPNLMTAATLIMLMHLAMTLRWYWAAKYLDIPLSFTKALFIFPYSMLGALTLFGPLGGDCVRFAMLKTLSDHNATNVFQTVLMDRLLSLAGMGIAGIALLGFYAYQHDMNYVLKGIAALLALGIASMAIILKILHTLKSRLTQSVIFNTLLMIAGNLNPIKLASLVAISVASGIITIYTGVALTLIAKLLGNIDIPLLEGSLAATIGHIASSIPLTPGGIGFGEAGFQEAIKLISSGTSENTGATPYFMFRMLNIFTSVILVSVFTVYFLNSKKLRNQWLQTAA